HPILGAAVGTRTPAAGDQRLDRRVRRTPAQRPAQVDAAHRIEAEVPHAVGRQAASIAVGAERRRCRRDDAEYGAVAQAEAIRRCRRILDYGLDPAVALLEPL